MRLVAFVRNGRIQQNWVSSLMINHSCSFVMTFYQIASPRLARCKKGCLARVDLLNQSLYFSFYLLL